MAKMKNMYKKALRFIIDYSDSGYKVPLNKPKK